MSLEQATSVLIIALFVFFIFWGRSAAGQAALTRVFGAPLPRNSLRTGTAKKRATASTYRAPATKTSSSVSRRSATRRGGKK